MNTSINEQNWQQWFEAIWADREDRLYRDFFGDIGPGIYTIPAATFASLGAPSPDPRFLTHGVFECPPSDTRRHWLYVTSGMSNPWGQEPATIDPAAFSGLGYEFTLHTSERARWPIPLLHWLMAVQLLVAAGERPGTPNGQGGNGTQTEGHIKGDLLQRNDRIPLGGPLAFKEGTLTHLLVATPQPGIAEIATSSSVPPAEMPAYPPGFALASGQVELLLILGITAKENDFARTQGAESLMTLLLHHGVFPLTNPKRPSTI